MITGQGSAKKKELVGKYRGREWKRKGRSEAVNVHDFPDKDLGNPYGIYDLTNDTKPTIQ